MLPILLTVALAVISQVHSHGMMLEPPGRASRWRFNQSAPANYNDMETFCGGLQNTWVNHGGKCGICGDDYGDKKPRDHELGGVYGEGHIVASYAPGAIVPITVKIIANHKGHFVFEICNLDRQPETEECFKTVKISDGSDKYVLTYFRPKTFEMSIKLPQDMVCNHCVLRWHYKSANMWGSCGDGTSMLGCGPQEIYRSCADISIKKSTLW